MTRWISCALLPALYMLSTTLAHQLSAHETARRLVDEYESKLHFPLWHRIQSDTAPVRTGPIRRSLRSRADAIAKTQRILTEHNADNTRSYYLGWNDLSDLSDEEYLSFLRTRPHPSSTHRVLSDNAKRPTANITVSFADLVAMDAQLANTAVSAQNNANASTDPLPKEWNWLEIEGGMYLTPIKNQGTCGSCWAFSALSVIESRYAIENNVQATPLSVEQVLSCSAPLDHVRSKFTNMIASSQGCDGGMPFLAYDYMSRLSPNGVACANDYPYVMATKATSTQCQNVQSSEVAVGWTKGVTDYVAVESNNEHALMRAVLSGPVSSNLLADGDGFRHYAGGIYDATDCASNGTDVNHAVVVVGYGETTAGEKYWLARNTWGTMWGENGYIRIARGVPSQQHYGPCNLYSYSTYPINLTKGPASGTTCKAQELVEPFKPLSKTALVGIDLMQWTVLVGIALGVVTLGMAVYALTEVSHKHVEDASYEEVYARWILPTKEQISVVLTRRRQRLDEA